VAGYKIRYKEELHSSALRVSAWLEPPWTSPSGMSTRAPITNDRPRVTTACHSGTGAVPGK